MDKQDTQKLLQQLGKEATTEIYTLSVVGSVGTSRILRRRWARLRR